MLQLTLSQTNVFLLNEVFAGCCISPMRPHNGIGRAGLLNAVSAAINHEMTSLNVPERPQY